MNGQSFLKGAVIISVGGVLAKILGALYRIPLTNLLGGEGMGIYQMVYPLYCLLLTVSATGIPSGLAREISRARAQGNEGRVRGVFARSLLLFSALGLLGALAMAALAPVMSRVQGVPAARASYLALAPGVLFVSVISCFRGYFQGKSNFTPTALSELVEQAVKVALGLYFATRYRENVPLAVSYCLLAVTLSEIAATIFLFIYAKFDRPAVRPLYAPKTEGVKSSALLKITVPVTLSAAILPLSNILDSVLIVNLLSRHSSGATALYGLYAGGATTLVNLPASVCYGLAAAILPAVTALYAVGNCAEAERRAAFALKCTFVIAVPAAAYLAVFAEPAVRFLFRSLGGAESEITVSLVRTMALSAIFLSSVQTLASVLTGKGKPKVAALAMLAGVGAKTALEWSLLQSPRVSVSGAAIAATACYFVAFAIDLLYTIKDKKNLAKILLDFIRIAVVSAIAVGAAYPLRHWGALPALGVCVAVYALLALPAGVLTREELSIFKRRKYDRTHRLGN